MSLLHSELQRLLRYDPETGVWTWLVGRNKGKRADHPNGNGYLRIRIAEKKFFSQRLAWFYMTGKWPPADAEHRDLDRANNKWNNLRTADRSQNGHNKNSVKNEYKGVFFIKKLGRYRAQICVRGRKHSLGYADTAREAHLLYKAAAEHFMGDFARVR